MTGCILWDFVVIEEKYIASFQSLFDTDTVSAKIENTILCSNARIGAKAQIKDCEFGTGFEAKAEGKCQSFFRRSRADLDSRAQGREVDCGSGSMILHMHCRVVYRRSCLPSD